MTPRRGPGSGPRGFGAVAASMMRSATDTVKRAVRRSSAQSPDPDAVTVSYKPRRDGHPDPGEVVWGWMPFEEDHSQGKDRPAVVIGFAGRRLALVPLTSVDQHGRPDTFPLGSGGWDAEGRPSWAKLDRIVGMDPSTVRREGAALDAARFEALIARLRAVHGPSLRLTD